jgi:ABC-type multidrug transport system ATPase subunit
MNLLEQVDIAEHAHKLPTAISGGQQQRAAIARALANDPPIIVADEPTGNLDSRTAGQVFDLFDRLVHEHNKTLLMVTHDDDQAQRVNRTIILADGEIVNEYLVRALPTLTGEQMLKVSKKLHTRKFAPGEPIIVEGTEGDSFYLVTRGEVHVYLQQPEGSDLFVDTLSEGQYFGEIALMKGGVRTATVRASRIGEVEVAVLSKRDFEDMMGDSEVTRSVLQRTMNERSERVARTRDEASK